MEEVRLIVWNAAALDRFANELEVITQTSRSKAEQLEKAILSRLQQAAAMPERYAKDKFKKNNSGQYRAFEIHN